MYRPLFVNRSTTPVPLDTHLLLLCEMLDAIDEEDPPASPDEASVDAA
ncbi:MAG: hypothetical protein J6K29_04475 [Clostridia bacterium]|jgi:hypothetical protein|nr:hypothetical protein [Clostridia bacterium]MBQ2249089.1 hypothetical protein [Clostridia bacterium]